MTSAYDQAGADDAGEPLANDPMTAEEMNAIDDDRLELLGASLAIRRDQWVEARKASKVEKRWLEDLDQYNGRDRPAEEAASMMESVEAGFPVTKQQAKPQRSTVFVNITRPKTNAAEARVANMVLPSDDRNWGLKPTPDPKLTQQALQEAQALNQLNQQQGQPPSSGQQPATPGQQPQAAPQPSAMQSALQWAYPTQQAQAQLEIASKTSQAMQDELDQQLIECDYNGELRKMLHDAAMLGTGVVKGPIVVNRVKKAYKKIDGTNVWKLEIEEEKSPASERVDPWDVYPDPGCGEDVHDGIGIFEKRMVTSRQLRELTKQPGYLKEQISLVLEQGPTAVPDVSERNVKEQSEGKVPLGKDHFQLWEYWGEFLPEDLRACGVNVPDGLTESISGCVIIVNETVIKGYLNPIETGDLPYDFMVWEKVEGTPWGYGVPRLCRAAQRVLNAAWRQVMDNASVCVGPQVVLDTQAIVPMDGRWEISARKLWAKISPDANVRDVFSTFNIDSHIEELQTIIKMAQEFIDAETMVPELAQGEKGTAPDTVGGMTLLMNSSNVVLGRMVKQFDDMVTRPHIRRYYDWYMAYGAKDECKGDFQVDARGTSVLLVRDSATQALLQQLQYAGNPVIGPLVNWPDLYKAVLKQQHIDPTDILKTDAEIAKQAAQPPAPSPEQLRAQTALQVAQIKTASDQKLAQDKAQREQQTEQDIATRDQQLDQAKMQQDALIASENSRQKNMDRAHEALEAAKGRDHDAHMAVINQSLSQPTMPTGTNVPTAQPQIGM
ncbi:MAG: hypothetical protein JO269_09605 [Burkholderiaceae bacterium]|nr:hypothetical protein [Burkholderiaceae bacterium]